MRSAFGFFAVFSLIVAGLLLLVRLFAPSALQAEGDQARLVYLLLFLVLIGGGTFSASKAQMAVALRQALIWIALFMAVIVAYSFRQDFTIIGNRVRSEILPAAPIEIEQSSPRNSASTVAIRKSADGQFHADGRVGRAHVRFLVDTGASSIALTLNDAKRSGIEMDNLQFLIPVSTASGQTFGAHVVLDKVSIGSITLRNVDAIVLKQGLDTSLLGMSFLGRLQKMEASRNQLILKK
ncbi:MAG: hypothetical protein COA47_06220 [Robiginitomaculum sp.]|nr:MAG: hypothetical protein COA47_06220 [Robiginitomaculum sp.]